MQSGDGTAVGTAVVTTEGGDAGANNFYKDGITIKCPNAKVGDKGMVDGVEYTKLDRDELRRLIGRAKSPGTIGYQEIDPQLSKACTSDVTDMSNMIQSNVFNQPMGHWDTSSVTTMYRAFYEATKFNQDISGWDTSQVTDMSEMFSSTMDFNKPIGNWNTAKVTNMEKMFDRANVFNQDISKWNTGSVTNMEEMFSYAKDFNQDIGGWDTSSVTNMKRMFYQAAAFNQDLSGWKVGAIAGETSCDKFCFGAPQIINLPTFRGLRGFLAECGFPGCL